MTEDPATGGPPHPVDLESVVLAGHRRDEPTARKALRSPDPAVRAAAVGALARMDRLEPATAVAAMADQDPVVRRRACDEAPRLAPVAADPLEGALRTALGDPDPLVVEAACWALGERHTRSAVGDLSTVARRHPDARCREAAVAALGAVGDPAGKPAVLEACARDRPAVRRRAVVALAAFDGPDVERALRTALDDRDWQVRQAAEVLLAE